MNSENAFKQLGQKLMNGEITPEDHSNGSFKY